MYTGLIIFMVLVVVGLVTTYVWSKRSMRGEARRYEKIK
jgi:hypothetical protein